MYRKSSQSLRRSWQRRSRNGLRNDVSNARRTVDRNGCMRKRKKSRDRRTKNSNDVILLNTVVYSCCFCILFSWVTPVWTKRTFRSSWRLFTGQRSPFSSFSQCQSTEEYSKVLTSSKEESRPTRTSLFVAPPNDTCGRYSPPIILAVM